MPSNWQGSEKCTCAGQDLQRLPEENQQAARGPLTGERDKRAYLAQSLQDEETLEEDDLVQILGPGPTTDTEEKDDLHTYNA